MAAGGLRGDVGDVGKFLGGQRAAIHQCGEHVGTRRIAEQRCGGGDAIGVTHGACSLARGEHSDLAAAAHAAMVRPAPKCPAQLCVAADRKAAVTISSAAISSTR